MYLSFTYLYCCYPFQISGAHQYCYDPHPNSPRAPDLKKRAKIKMSTSTCTYYRHYFFPLSTPPAQPTIIAATVWEPSRQRNYPLEFKRATVHLLLPAKSGLRQTEGRLNVAAMLPISIWLEILSYAPRRCE